MIVVDQILEVNLIDEFWQETRLNTLSSIERFGCNSVSVNGEDEQLPIRFSRLRAERILQLLRGCVFPLPYGHVGRFSQPNPTVFILRAVALRFDVVDKNRISEVDFKYCPFESVRWPSSKTVTEC